MKQKKSKKTKLGQALIKALKEELDSRKKKNRAKIKDKISKYYPERDITEDDITGCGGKGYFLPCVL